MLDKHMYSFEWWCDTGMGWCTCFLYKVNRQQLQVSASVIISTSIIVIVIAIVVVDVVVVPLLHSLPWQRGGNDELRTHTPACGMSLITSSRLTRARATVKLKIMNNTKIPLQYN